jgi:hypothetical protein
VEDEDGVEAEVAVGVVEDGEEEEALAIVLGLAEVAVSAAVEAEEELAGGVAEKSKGIGPSEATFTSILFCGEPKENPGAFSTAGVGLGVCSGAAGAIAIALLGSGAAGRLNPNPAAFGAVEVKENPSFLGAGVARAPTFFATFPCLAQNRLVFFDSRLTDSSNLTPALLASSAITSGSEAYV